VLMLRQIRTTAFLAHVAEVLHAFCVLSATSRCFRGLTAGMCCVVVSVCVLVPVFPLIFAHMFCLKSKEDGSCSACNCDQYAVLLLTSVHSPSAT
jgi:hypothetical protein